MMKKIILVELQRKLINLKSIEQQNCVHIYTRNDIGRRQKAPLLGAGLEELVPLGAHIAGLGEALFPQAALYELSGVPVVRVVEAVVDDVLLCQRQTWVALLTVSCNLTKYHTCYY
eukprot:GHVR01116149.1.p1 GENE.GHVR01116149.1~~GHVR01116149.1.p1  ORF type:complete len:116 (+),score=12.18 GHVR01116149.1:1213-1560(+)